MDDQVAVNQLRTMAGYSASYEPGARQPAAAQEFSATCKAGPGMMTGGGDAGTALHSSEIAGITELTRMVEDDLSGALRAILPVIESISDREMQPPDSTVQALTAFFNAIDPVQLCRDPGALSVLIKEVPKLVQGAPCLEIAIPLFRKIGLTSVVNTIEDPMRLGGAAWWLNKSPLITSALDLTYNSGPEEQTFYHATNSWNTWKSICSRADGHPNGLASRGGVPGESSDGGTGMYCARSLHGTMNYGRYVVAMKLSPHARPGIDYLAGHKPGEYLLVNPAAAHIVDTPPREWESMSLKELVDAQSKKKGDLKREDEAVRRSLPRLRAEFEALSASEQEAICEKMCRIAGREAVTASGSSRFPYVLELYFSLGPSASETGRVLAAALQNPSRDSMSLIESIPFHEYPKELSDTVVSMVNTRFSFDDWGYWLQTFPDQLESFTRSISGPYNQQWLDSCVSNLTSDEVYAFASRLMDIDKARGEVSRTRLIARHLMRQPYLVDDDKLVSLAGRIASCGKDWLISDARRALTMNPQVQAIPGILATLSL
jgi:hypothetical protein